jgi:hypothetical protein
MSAVLFWLWLLLDVNPIRVAGLYVTDFILIGILHAVSVVVSLRNRRTNQSIIALSFVALAGVWSAATPFLALFSLWFLHGGLAIVLIFAAGSAIGSAGYWLLVRLFWLKWLRPLDCFRTISVCVGATLLSFAVGLLNQGGGGRNLASLLFTMAWWFAFSLSLYWSETTRRRENSAALLAGAS